MIDWTKPIEVDSYAGRRKAFVKRVFQNGSALVAIDSENDPTPIIYDEEGKFVGNPDPRSGEGLGAGLVITNIASPGFLVPMSAEELAFVRVLLGASTGSIGYALFSAVERLVEVGYPEIEGIYDSSITLDTKSEGFRELVKAYEEKVHGEPLTIKRNPK